MIPRNVLVTAPAAEPVSVKDVKANLRIAIDDDDAFLRELIKDATDWVENDTNRALITQTRKQIHDRFPCDGVFHIRRSPVISVTSIIYTDTNGTSQTVASTVYRVDTDKLPGRITEARDQDWPTDEADITGAVEVTYQAGYGTSGSSVPRMYKRAITLLASYYYDPNIGCGKTPDEFMDSIRCMLANEGRTLEYA